MNKINRSNISNNEENHKFTSNEKSKSKQGKLREKHFELRNSLLTDLFETVPHVETIHHIFVATLISFFVNTVIHDYFVHREINLGLNLIYSGFKNIHIVLFVWLAILTLACLCYYAFTIWAKGRIRFPPKSRKLRMWDTIWLLSVLSYYGVSFKLASSIVSALEFPPASAAIVLIEQVRLMMKVHAFIRTNAEEFVKHKTNSDKDAPELKFSKFIYFLFIPTFIYRNEYPRTKEIRWRFVLHRALEIAGVIMYHSFILDKFFIAPFKDFGLRTYTWTEIIVTIFDNSIPGLLLKISGFYLLLHSVQNLFAELLRFGDRLFYQDWWTSTSSSYFRKWNVVVHDWLFDFVYKDVCRLTGGHRGLAKLAVFLLSAVVHEWVLVHMFGFFFPALFVFFLGVAFGLSFVKTPKNVEVALANVLFWYFLAVCSGWLVSMYTLEYFARKNSVDGGDSGSLRDYLLPKWLTCDWVV